jgi:DNA-binding CsgD family transcriptional regulator
LLAGGFYLAHSLGFYINSLSFNVFSTGQTRISVLSMLAVYLLAMILFVVLRRANAQNDTAITLSGELLADANGETGSIDIASTDSETPSHFSTGINIAEMTRFYQLSPREGEILELLLNGRSVPYIANSLFLSQNTVRGHTKSLYRKLNVHSKQELIDCALASPQKLS